MPTTTPNLGLTKDAEGEPYSLARINANSDRLDTFAGEALTDTVYDTTNAPALIKKRKIDGVETPVTVEKPDTVPTEGSKHLITSDAVHAALASKQDALTEEQLAAANSGITAAKLTADEAALEKVVDNGAKNLSDVNSVTNQQNYIDIDVNLKAGKYIISAGSISTTSSDTSIRIGVYKRPNNLLYTYIDVGTNKYSEFEISGDADIVRVFATNSASISSDKSLTFSDLMICTAADWAISQKFVPYARTNRDLTVLTDEDRASLVELVDGGGKNLLKVGAVGVSNIYGTTYEDNGVTYTLNSDGTVSLSGTASAESHTNLRLSNGSVITIDDFCNGNYVLSGCPSGGRGVFNLRARTADNAYILFDIGSGVTLTNRGAYSGIFISIFVQGGKDCTGLTFSPMICTKAAWDIAHTFVPYCPSMAEMYDMILALQNGTRSAPALAKAEPEVEPETGEEEMR